MRFFSAVRLCISKTHWQAARSLLFPISPLFQRQDAPFVVPSLFPTRRAKSSPSPDGEHTSGAPRSLRMSGTTGGGAGRYWWKMKERTVCRTLPGCGGHPGGEIGQMLRSVSAGLCFTITTAAEGWGVCTHLNLGFLTRRRQPRSLKPFCNENPLSRRSESDISTSYLDLFAAPLYLFAFSLNVSSLILELLLGVHFVFFAAWPEIPWSLSPRTFVPASKELPSSSRGSVRTIKGGLQCDLGRQRTGPGSRLRSLWSPACMMNTNVPPSSLPGPNKEVCQCVSEVPWNWTGPHVWTGLGRCWHI